MEGYLRVGEILVEVAPENARVAKSTVEVKLMPLETLSCCLALQC
jgi:hypothetical protein